MDGQKIIENLIASLNYCKNLKSCAVTCKECPYCKADLFDIQGDCRTELIKDAGEILLKYLDLGTPDYIQFAHCHCSGIFQSFYIYYFFVYAY